MVVLTILSKLKKRSHKELSIAQDILLNEIYNYFEKSVIHGGTSIWRCYGGSRFSEDIDVYLPLSVKKTASIKNFSNALESKGFIIKKFREKENSIYSAFVFGNSVVRFEAVFKNVNNYIVKPFELSEGRFLNVYTFSPEDLIKEKVDTYLSRRKVRDLYDIFFLLNSVREKSSIKKDLSKLLDNFKDPADAGDLKALIISGAVPNVSGMLEAIKVWVK